ncbi:acyl-CoA carboxylase subunit epsilon [Candidatus Mycolicibacterium alkanivorans]|uniref:Acyl-CoA carboxylase subunit epsilon n=1 Tax=Candidatus Mycolicibacterium alkanivorans TaxID=2954114 RepID=A0ABS9Z0Y0_9MYCO|nr:acyl-CoA carboxylase subunit epsilon [Candidatus Mycolicibacterium alkanivorans]MCI4676837.1 acyl-CoA carboxylase subunit epsilon [Candidatus Mycolicibacterium alkanivorans]
MKHADITEVSDPRDITLDAPEPGVPEIRIERGDPTDEDIAALLTGLASAGGGRHAPGPQEVNLWGHPVDKLRYTVTSWQRVTLLERTHMRK